MSPADGRDPETGNIRDGHLSQVPSQPVPNQPFKGETNLGDSSGFLFAMYSKLTQEEDTKMAERWQKDAEGIIIFNGLFSAVVASLVVLSIQDLKPDPQDTSAFYLKQIYELQADTNVSRPSVVTQPTFSPPTYAIFVNSLWFLSLVISLTCAMLATSVQQWARRYLRITQPAHSSSPRRARMRAFFSNGVEQFRVAWAVEALPGLVHLSLSIFFAGLLIYLWNVHRTVFSAVLCWVGLLLVVYGTITLMPIFRLDSPYYAPLSSTAWFLYTSIQVLFGAREEIGSVEMEAAEAAARRSSAIDVRILEWTIDALSDDDALEYFFESFPNFYKADLFKDPRHALPEETEWKIMNILNGFLRRTLTSNSLSGLVKSRRFAICLNAANEVQTSFGVRSMCRRIIEEVNWSLVPHSVEIGHFLRSWDKSNNGRFNQYVQGIVAHIVAGVWERNDRWMALARDHLGISERLLHEYLGHGDSVLLANLIHLTRQLSRSDWVTSGTLRPLTKFDIYNTLPRLQHDFCAMWNEIVQESRSRGALSRLRTVLKAIRHIYVALHPDAGETRTRYPPCRDVGHHLNSFHGIQEVPVLSVGESSHPRATTSASIMDQRHASPSFLPASHSDHATLRLADEPSPVALPGPSSHPTPEVPPPSPAIPLDPATTTSTRANAPPSDIPSVVIFDPYSTPIASFSGGTDEHNTDHGLVSLSMAPETSVSPSLIPHSSGAPSTDLQSFTHASSPSDQPHSFPEHTSPNPATAFSLLDPQGSPDTPDDDQISIHPLPESLLPDIAPDLSSRSLDATASSQDPGHSV